MVRSGLLVHFEDEPLHLYYYYVVFVLFLFFVLGIEPIDLLPLWACHDVGPNVVARLGPDDVVRAEREVRPILITIFVCILVSIAWPWQQRAWTCRHHHRGLPLEKSLLKEEANLKNFFKDYYS